MFLRGIAWVGLALLAACRPVVAPAPGPAAVPQSTPFDAVPYPEGRLPRGGQIFLVAGGDDIANFAQEVVEQRTLWRNAGASAQSIACYWAKPPPPAFEADRVQYNALADELGACRRAEPATLRGDLTRAAADKPSWVYLFVTSHGLPPLLQWALQTDDRREIAQRLTLSYAQLDALDQHSIGLQSGPGPRLEQARDIAARFREGAPLGDLMFSPSTLAQTLREFPAQTIKIVVLQACFSGGFIGDTTHTPQAGAAVRTSLSPLTEVPNIVILTATAGDRPSFGCGAGSVTTYYGGALNKALARRLRGTMAPHELAWEQIWEDTAFVIEAMESIDGERASKPAFFSNVEGTVVVR